MTTPAAAQREIPVGLHTGVSYPEYELWDAARHSVLRHFNRTPAHALEALRNPPASTRAKELGHAIHKAVLEPGAFDRDYVSAPKVDRTTTIGKHRYRSFLAENIGKTVLDADEFVACVRIRDSVWAHPTARQLLEGVGLNEVSALWKDGETGMACKSRLDRLTTLSGRSAIADLKSGRNASPRAFERDIFTFHYHQQGAFYLDGCDALTAEADKRERAFLFIVVETEAPYLTAVYELDDDAIALGRDEYRAHLATYARCLETGRWPGYADGVGSISLPTWAFKFHGEQS